MTADDRIATTLERIATALEQFVLDRMPAGLPTGEPPLPTPPPEYLQQTPPGVIPTVTVPLPPVAAPFQFTGPTASCPVHHLAWRTVPAGVSKKTGKPYGAFLVCPESSCEERPRA